MDEYNTEKAVYTADDFGSLATERHVRDHA